MSKTKLPGALCGEDLDKALDRIMRRKLNLMDTTRKAENVIARLSDHVCRFERRDEHGRFYKPCRMCDDTKLNTDCVQRCASEERAVNKEFSDLLCLRIAELHAELGPLRGEPRMLQHALFEVDMLRIRSELLEADISETECWLRMGRAAEKFNDAHPRGFALDYDLEYEDIVVQEWEIRLEDKIEELGELTRQRDQALKRVMGMRR